MESSKLDLHYSIDQFVMDGERDTVLFLRRIEAAVRETVGWAEAAGRRPRLLDVACGTGQQAARLHHQGWETVGIDASESMLGLAAFVSEEVPRVVRRVRGIAEALPFRDASFDAVLCQGSMDHFAEPERFFAEATRLLRPGGRLIVALANYDSLSCRVGRGLFGLRRRFGLPVPTDRLYWQIPHDHTFKGTHRLLRAMGGNGLALERIYGVSLFQFMDGWRFLLNRLPERAGTAAWRVADRLAYFLPAAADLDVAVWRRRNDVS
jgi:SAM-dependent methyltransferase